MYVKTNSLCFLGERWSYQSKILEFMSSIGQEGVPIETVPLLTLLLLEHGSYLPCCLYYAIAIIMPHTC